MIVDKIVDRMYGGTYSIRDFYVYCYGKNGYAGKITKAFDEGINENIQKALCEYIIGNEYNDVICDYICSVNWLEED